LLCKPLRKQVEYACSSQPVEYSLGKILLRTTAWILLCAAPLCAQTSGFSLNTYLGASVLAILSIAIFYALWEKLEKQRGILVAILALMVIAVIYYWPAVLHWIRGSAINLDIR
jgi:uncharacterized membrane protein